VGIIFIKIDSFYQYIIPLFTIFTFFNLLYKNTSINQHHPINYYHFLNIKCRSSINQHINYIDIHIYYTSLNISWIKIITNLKIKSLAINNTIVHMQISKSRNKLKCAKKLNHLILLNLQSSRSLELLYAICVEIKIN
jgi:hypothetical protein